MSAKQTYFTMAVLALTILYVDQVRSTDVQSISAAVQRNLLQVADKHGLPVAAAEEKPKIPLKEPEAKSPEEQKDQPAPLAAETASLTKMNEAGAAKPTAGFTHAFIASLSVIIVSELGDKTFFIAAIMAMTHSRLTVLMGAIAALFAMTILSALVGYATTVIPRALTYYVSSALFAVFGLKMLREGWVMSEDEGKEEYEEVQADLKRREDEIEKQNMSGDIETGTGFRSPGRRFLSGILSTVFLQSLTLTFLAEWGDRSQIATIILGAREDVFGVVVGGCLGHFLCTGLAVLGGRFVAQRISVRTVTLLGGVVFLIFALSALWIGPGE